MKFKAFFVILLMMTPLICNAQTNPVFYNKGRMYVGGDYNFLANGGVNDLGKEIVVTQKNTVLMVDGSMGFDAGSLVATGDSSAISLTGDFVSLVPKTNVNKENLFVSYRKNGKNTPDQMMGAKGFLFFTKQTDVGNVTLSKFNAAGTVNKSTSTLDTYGKQVITMKSTDKKNHFMVLPEIISQKLYKEYSAAEKIAINAGTQKGGLLVVDSSVAMVTKRIQPSYNGLLLLQTRPDNTRTLYAPQIIGHIPAYQGVVADGDNLLKNVKGYGATIHDIQLYDPAVTAVYNNNNKSNIIEYISDKDKTVAMTGFTPLGRYWYADHMFFNMLTRPVHGNFTEGGHPIIDPKYEMKAGYGYFMAVDPVPGNQPYHQSIEEEQIKQGRPNIKRINRATGGYQFGGRAYKDGTNPFIKPFFNIQGSYKDVATNYYSEEARPFSMESLSGAGENYENILSNAATYNNPVIVELKQGMNYLGNPYTAPLDLSDIASVPKGSVRSLTVWHPDNATDNTKVYYTSPDNNPIADIRSQYMVPHDAKVRYYINSNNEARLKYTTQYFIAQSGAGTSDLGISDDYKVAPMQMFLLEASKDLKLKIPASKATFANVKATRSTEDGVESKNNHADELLLQSVIFEQRDGGAIELAEDRLCIKLTDGASVNFLDERTRDTYETIKKVTNIVGGTEKGAQMEVLKTVENGVVNTQTYPGLIYTKSYDGANLMTNVLPTTTANIGVYFAPANKVGTVVRITPYRMDTWNNIQNAWLEDKLGDRDNHKSTFTKIEEGMEPYESISNPGDPEARYVIHFNYTPSGAQLDITNDEKPIICYYDDATLFLLNLNNDDVNSKVQIYDLQGRLMGQHTISQWPTQSISKNLVYGTYIVKITGKRNLTTKFITLQN